MDANFIGPFGMIPHIFRTATAKREKELLGVTSESGGALALMAVAATSDAT
jgi:hypothetical protein